MSFFKKSYLFVLVHFICWLILAAGVLYAHPTIPGVTMPSEFWIKQSILLALLMGVFYLNLYWLIPRFLFQQKVIVYIGLAVVLLVAVTALNMAIGSVFNLNRDTIYHPHPATNFKYFGRTGRPRRPMPPGAGPDNHRRPMHAGQPDRPQRFNNFGDNFRTPGLLLLVIGLGITISFIQKWQHEVALRQKLEQEKVSTELTLLKAQINPHFFFNTLNTIYSYTLSDGDMARTAITNLSKMMRYVLYDAAERQTPLRKEIAFIGEYIELMKLRISKKTAVLVDLQERKDEAMIAPMLFLPFVENAFKHGTSGITEGHITVLVVQHTESVELVVRNTVYETRRASEEESNGIGIVNTKRRLGLLYPGKYTLQIGMISANEYEARLTLQL